MGKYRVGIDAGGTKVAYGLYDDSDNLVYRHQHPTPEGANGPEFCDIVIKTVNEIIGKSGVNKEDVKGVGICMPSYIFFDEGYIKLTSNMPNVKEFAFRDYMNEHMSIPVIMDNDANVAALSEHRFGAGRGSKHMVYVATSTGLGGGIILNGQVFRGSYGSAGEIGHMLITPNQPKEAVVCGCGKRGCFEPWVSGRFIDPQFRLKLNNRETIVDLNQKITGEVFYKACEAKDPVALEVLEQMAFNLGLCMLNIYQVLNVNLYVFGGGLTNFGDMLYKRAKEVFDEYDNVKLPVEWKFAEAKQDFGIIGAAELVREL